MLTDAAVAEYIGCSQEQVRIMRLREWRCLDCEAVHVSFPTIRPFHSPLCASNQKCASCGEAITGLMCGHEVGLICGTCHDK